MRIAVTGKSGQVVSALRDRAQLAGLEVIAIGRPKLDLVAPETVITAIKAASPDVIVSAAAYTAVDKAEAEATLARATNAAGAGAVARAAKAIGVPLIHLSTDYVFDGRLGRPYVENDACCPTGVYGASKLDGERAVLGILPENSAILRVAWVYSPFGGNFVKTMLRLAGERNEVAVVADQLGNPTCAFDIADGILRIAGNLVSSKDANLRGLFHMTGQDEASWADFAEGVFAASAALGGATARVRRISTAEFSTAAARPMNSRLNCDKLAKAHGVTLPGWKSSVGTTVNQLLRGFIEN